MKYNMSLIVRKVKKNFLLTNELGITTSIKVLYFFPIFPYKKPGRHIKY